MNILIAGGSGMIGIPLVSKLIETGHRVTVISRSPEKAKSEFAFDVHVLSWDSLGKNGLGEFKDVDGVINLAGVSIGSGFWTKSRKSSIVSSRVNVGNALVNAIRQWEKKPSVFIQASAVGFYGSRGDELLLESTKAGVGFLPETCLAWEGSTEEVEKMGVRRVIIRTGFVLDRSGGGLPLLALPFHLFFGGRAGSGKQWLPWIHLADEVNAICFLLEKVTSNGIYNLSAPNPVRNFEFGTDLAKVLHRPYWFPVPELLMKLVLGDMADLVLDSQRMIPDRLTRDGFHYYYPDLNSALMEIYRTKK